MKTSARFLAMLLAVVMIASAALSVSAFSDVTGAVEHATAINVLAQLGVIGGYEDGTFKPEQNVTRAEMAKLVYVLYTTFTDAGAGAVKFDDVKADNWAAGYISWCASKNIIGGYGDGKFGPNDNVTYDQALKMVAGTLGYNNWDSAQWPTDVRMKALNDLNLGTDMPETVKGSDKLTRAQVAQIMYNALQAEMNETKSTTEYITSDDGAKIPFTFPVAKKLAVDVWKFDEVSYIVTDKTTKDNVTTLTLTPEKGKALEFKLSELGLGEYEGKAEDLMGLSFVGLVKNEKTLGTPSLLGTIKDEVKVTFKSSKKTITIDGVEYDKDDFIDVDEDATVIAITVDGEAVTEVFAKDEKDVYVLNEEITKALMPNSQYLARTIDKDGDGEIDQLMIVPKYAYKVENVKTTAKDGTTVKLVSLDGEDTLTTNAKNINIELAEKDVVVAGKLGASVYAEKVEGVTTYATRLNTSANKVTLNNVGEVIYAKQTVAGLAEIKINTGILGSDNTDTYYIYNGEVLLKEKVSSTSDYTFAIMRYVEKSDDELDKVSMTKKTTYTANILVLEDGKLVEKTLPISSSVGEVLVKKYPADDTEKVFEGTADEKDVIAYNYALITSYEEDKDGYYDIKFDILEDEVLGGDETPEYVLVEDATFKYTAKTKIFSVGSYNKVKVNDDSVIYYKDQLTTTAAKGFTDMKFYTKSSLTTKDFSVLANAAVLRKDDSGRYNLLALIAKEAIKGSTGDVVDYTTDGRLVLFAPEGSSVELVDGKNYNSYIFMDNKTLEVKEAVIDTAVEYGTSNKGTEAGNFYGYDTTSEKYVLVTKSSALETIKSTKLAGVLLDEELIEFKTENGTDFINVASDVVIWGLAEKDKYDVFTQFTLAELAEMLELVEEKTEEDIDVIMTYYKDSNDDYVLASVIVEVFVEDEDDDDNVYSVNADIFTNFNK